MKSIRFKIVSIFLVTVVLFSISGFSFHFHYCNTQKKLFTDFHITSVNNDFESCCPIDLFKDQCCANDCSDRSSPAIGFSECCVDIFADFETDNEYESQNFKTNLIPAELSLPYVINNNLSQKYISLHTVQVDFQPPDLLSTVVLLL